MSGPLLPGQFKPLGFVQAGNLSVAGNIAVLGNITVPPGTGYALVQAVTQNVLWRDDGSVPTASAGMVISAGGDPVGFTGSQIKTASFIQATASAILNVSFYG